MTLASSRLTFWAGRQALLIMLTISMCGTLPATVVRISKSYPKGFAVQPDGSYQASSPIYIDDALAQGGYASNLNADGMNEVIFMDAGNYVITDDIAADPTQPAWQPGPICFGFGGNGGNFGEVGAGGILIRGSSLNRPTLDFSNLPVDSWGGHVLFHIYQHRAGQNIQFKNLFFKSTTPYDGTGMGYTEAAVRIGGSGGPAPTFEECFFDVAHQILSCGVWGSGSVPATSGIEFRKCVFWLRYDAAQQRRNMVIYQTTNPSTGTFEFEDCSFIGKTTASWSILWGSTNDPAYSFTRCILYNLASCVKYATPAVYNENCDFPVVSGKTAGTGNLSVDPIFLSANTSATLQPHSPCVRTTLPNIGYDQVTRPAGSPTPTPTPSPTPTATPYVLHGPRVSVESLMGVPTFKFDQSWHTIPGFSNYWPATEYLSAFRDAGVRLVDFPATGSRSDYTRVLPVWTGTNPDTWNNAQIDQFFAAAIGTNPNTWVMPRLDIGTPDWWLNDPANAQELEVLDTGSTNYTETGILPRSGPFPSLASTKWRTDMAKAIRRYLDYVEFNYGDNIAGYKLMGLGTDEWYHWSSGLNTLSGFSVPTRDAFRQWLRTEYGNDVQALRNAWNNANVTFDTAAVPTKARRQANMNSGTFRDMSQFRDVVDFYQFYNELIPDTVDYFASVIKQYTNNTKAVGSFYGYFYEFNGNPEFGHNALEKYINSPNLDFVYVTASYGYRGLGTGGDYLRSQAKSVQLHGKLFWNDNDVASYKTKAIFENRFGWDAATVNYELGRLGYSPTVEQNRWMYQRNAGFITANGIFQDYFDLHGGYYDDPDLMAEVSRLNGFYNSTKNYDRGSNSEILVVSDEISAAYTVFNSQLNQHSLFEPQINLIKLGAQVDHLLFNDLNRINPAQYKLIIFLNCFNMTDAQRALLAPLKGGNRTLLWCYAPGYFNGSTAASGNMAVSGIQFTVGPDTRSAPRIILNQVQHPLSNALRNAGLTAFGPTASICRRIIPTDPSGTALGTWGNSMDTAFAIREYPDWRAIYVSTANLPAEVYQAIARYAGVNIYNDRTDTFYINKSYACISANGAGTRTLTFPNSVNIYNPFSNTLLATNVKAYTTPPLADKETLLLRYELVSTAATLWSLYIE